MIRIGIVGLGFMGWTHFSAAWKLNAKNQPVRSKLKGAAVTAICTRSPEKLAGNWTSIQGNFGPRGVHVDLSKISAYDRLDDLLKDPEIDLVDICLPNDQHEAAALAALRAGKHVLVEKPIAVDLKAAERMVQAAQRAGRLLMVAQVLPFFPEFKFARQCIQSQQYGRLLAAHFRRVISPPRWSSEMSDFRKLGGWGIDLHIHDNHFIQLICGLPQQVFSRGLLQDGYLNHVHTQYVYSEGPAFSAVSGGIASEGLAFAHGYELYFEHATLMYAAGTVGGAWCVDRPLTLITKGRVTQPKLKAATEWCAAFTAELQAAVESVKRGEADPILSGTGARDALRLCWAEAESVASGKPVKLR
ncbi:MAG: oxidoreductase [Planctomycetaceae bacterium]|nr:MAG: oxidoreductase [Planctomycetaceae bacterium]